MAQATSIEWTDLSWNSTHGCSRVSTGCLHCYAETLSLRYGQTTKPWTERNAPENVLLKPHKLREPLSNAKAWRGLGTAAAAAGKTDGKLVFVNSMSDLFHEQIPDEYIARVFAIMAAAQRHTFQILTKRPERMLAWFREHGEAAMCALRDAPDNPMTFRWPLPNVWLGVSIENRKWVGRADVLRDTPAAVRFISAEPLLGPLWGGRHYRNGTYEDVPGLDLTGIDWLIVGGESGPKHRPMDLQWARDLRDAAFETRTREPGGYALTGGCQVFVKQLGGSRPGTALEDLPEDLRIREFPAVRT